MRTTISRNVKIGKILVGLLLAGIGVALTILLANGQGVYEYFFMRDEELTAQSTNHQFSKEREEWRLKYDQGDWSQTTRDGLTLLARYYKAKEPTHDWVLLSFGEWGRSMYLEDIVMQLHERGVHILVWQLRAHGDNVSSTLGMGVLDQPDLLEWVRMTQLQDAQARIVLYGFSHSGAVILNCAPQLPSSVVGIVSDSAYSSMHEELLYLLKQQNEGKLQLFLPLVLFSAERYSVWNTGVSVSKSSPITAVARAPIPYLFFHSGSDSQIPVSMAEDIYENAAGLVWDGETGTKELVVMENAEHCQGIWQYPLLYWDHLDRFLLRWMPPEATS